MFTTLTTFTTFTTLYGGCLPRNILHRLRTLRQIRKSTTNDTNDGYDTYGTLPTSSGGTDTHTKYRNTNFTELVDQNGSNNKSNKTKI
jgi:hypothetical protein